MLLWTPTCPRRRARWLKSTTRGSRLRGWCKSHLKIKTEGSKSHREFKSHLKIISEGAKLHLKIKEGGAKTHLEVSSEDQGGESQVSPRVVRREPSITSRSGGVDKHRKLEAKPSLSIASGDHQAAKSSRRVKKSEDSLLKQKGRYSQWGYTRNGAVFSMGRCSKRGGALNGAGPYQLRSKAQVVAGGSWSVLAAPQEVTMRSGGQVVEEADRGAIYAQGGGTQRRKQGQKPCGDHATSPCHVITKINF